MGGLFEKLKPEKDAVMKWYTPADNITTNIIVRFDFTLSALSATNVVTWKYHVDGYTKGRYDMILGSDLST